MMFGVHTSEAGERPGENGVTVDHDGDAVVLRVWGELDLATAPRLQRRVETVLRDGPPPVLVIDLSAVTFLASAGMAVLVRAHRGGGAATRVRVVAGTRVTRRPLELTKLDCELAVFPTERQALAG